MSQDGVITVKCPPDYVKTIPGILKMIEMPLAIIAFACSMSASEIWVFGGGYLGTYSFYGGGWVNFVTISSFTCAAFFFVIRMLNVTVLHDFAEFFNYAFWTFDLFIAGIVAACRGAWHPTVAASAFFTFATLVVFAIDTAVQFPTFRVQWQSRRGGGATAVSTSDEPPPAQV